MGTDGNKLVIPDTLTLLNDWSFANCHSLSYVEIPNTLKFGTTAEEVFENVVINTLEIRVADGRVPLSGLYRGSFLKLKIGIKGTANSLDVTGPVVTNQNKLEHIFIGKGVRRIEENVFNGISTSNNVYFHIDNSLNGDNNILRAIPNLNNVHIVYENLT